VDEEKEIPKIIGTRDMDIVIHCHEETKVFHDMNMKIIPRTYSVKFVGIEEKELGKEAANLTYQYILMYPKIFSKVLKNFVDDVEYPQDWDLEMVTDLINSAEMFGYALKDLQEIIKEEDAEKEGDEED